MARVALTLMVRNEERIVARCLMAAAPHCDGVVLVDTGSEDRTVEVAEAACQLPLRVERRKWRNFGANRTESLEATREAAEAWGWDLSQSFALALDADMILRCSRPLRELLQQAPAEAPGFYLVQRSGQLEYINTRLMRLSVGWKCVGFTHEYWDGGQCLELCGSSEVFIEDVSDGGCKADKFERDLRLLSEDWAEAPKPRAAFYMAQTYHCLGRHEDAIVWYHRRVEFGGWVEEVWYSLLGLVRSHLSLGQLPEAELFAQRALALDPERCEALMCLVSHLRNLSQHHKAMHYLELAEKIPVPGSPKLFLELDAYGPRRLHERSILQYYVRGEGWRARGSFASLQHCGPDEWRSHLNARWYARQLREARGWRRLDFPAPEGYVSSSTSVDCQGRLCVRTVDYRIRPDGSYELRDGLVRTRSFLTDWDFEAGRHAGWQELLAPQPSPFPNSTILGLEDVRLVREPIGWSFTAATSEYSYEANRVCVAVGRIGLDGASVVRLQAVRTEAGCEKNWLPLGADRVLYRWHPLEVCRVTAESGLECTSRHATPPYFRHFRGSAGPCVVGDQLWALVHVVVHEAPRVYLHAFVVLDEDLRPKAHTWPFYFLQPGIEYCIGMHYRAGLLHLFVSVWDRETHVCSLEPPRHLLHDLRWS